EQERPGRIVAGRSLLAKRLELIEQFRDAEVDAAVVGLNPAPRLSVVVGGEHHARRAVENGVEEPFARLESLAKPRAVDASGVQRRTAGRGGPQRGGGRRVVRERRAERAIQQDRGDGAEAGVGGGGLVEDSGEFASAAPRRRSKRLEVLIAEDAGGFDQ